MIEFYLLLSAVFFNRLVIILFILIRISKRFLFVENWNQYYKSLWYLLYNTCENRNEYNIIYKWEREFVCVCVCVCVSERAHTEKKGQFSFFGFFIIHLIIVLLLKISVSSFFKKNLLKSELILSLNSWFRNRCVRMYVLFGALYGIHVGNLRAKEDTYFNKLFPMLSKYITEDSRLSVISVIRRFSSRLTHFSYWYVILDENRMQMKCNLIYLICQNENYQLNFLDYNETIHWLQ